MATAVRTPDAQLLRRLRARDRLAWEELYAEYQPRLRGFAYRLAGNAHDADDLVQETFVRAVPRLDRLDPDTADVGAYLFATLRNLFLKQVERQKRQQPVAEVPEPGVPTPIEDDPERRALLTRQQDEVRVANVKLQPRQRLVLALRELEERSYAEIGELVGMKENAVAQLIFRARESLRTELRLVQVDPERLPEECRPFLPLLAAHLDGQLEGSRRDETLAHLEGCERCQAALADMREASRRYRALLLPPIGVDEARAAVDRRLDEAGYWRPRGRLRLVRRSTRVALAVATALVLGAAGTALGVSLTRQPPRRAAALPAESTTPATPTTRLRPTETGGATTAAAAVARRPVKPKPARPPIAPAQSKPKPEAKAKPKLAPKVTSTSIPKPSPVSAPKPKPKVKLKAKATPKPKAKAKRKTALAPKQKAKPKPKVPPTPAAPTPAIPAPDTTAPTVTITDAPEAATESDDADVAFTASEDGVDFSCRLDAADYNGCKSPVHLSGLDPGQHTFSVRATDKAGTVGDPASVGWTYTPPDTTPPSVTIASRPPASTTETSASFAFSSSEPGSTFRCSLDGSDFDGCESPAAYSSLAVDSHTFSVQATDQAGNTGEPATASWTIVPLLPDLYVSAFKSYSITVANRGNAPAPRSVLTVTYVGTFTVPGLPPGGSMTFTWSTCRTATYTAIVDRTKVVTESDESNNTASRDNVCA